jgi:hypothetical protein
MDAVKDEPSFRVIDKRNRTDDSDEKSSASAATPATEEKKGDGFVMHGKEDAAPTEIDFPTLVYSFATSAMISLGQIQDPQTGKPTEINLGLAKQNIDILSLLQTKTQGNLTAEEAEMLKHFVTELRLLFVEVGKKR